MRISVNIKEGKKLELSPNWRSVENDPPEPYEIVIVLYMEYSNNFWEEYEVTVAKCDDWCSNWTDCLNMTNTNLNPLYWRPLPGAMD